MRYLDHFDLLKRALPDYEIRPLHWCEPDLQGNSSIIPMFLSYQKAPEGNTLIFKIEQIPEWIFQMRLPYDGNAKYTIKCHTKVNERRYGVAPCYFCWSGPLDLDTPYEESEDLRIMLQNMQRDFIPSWYAEYHGSPAPFKPVAYLRWYATCIEAIYKNLMGDVRGYTPKPFLGIKLLKEERYVEWNAWKRY